MAFCGKCGAQASDGVKFCPSCGAEVNAGIVQISPSGAAPDKDAQDNKAMAALAYILFFVPLLKGAHKTSPFVKYHTNQGTVLFIASVAWSVVYRIVSSILYAISWRLGWIADSILGWVSVVFLALCVIGIMNAINGKKSPLPVIGGVSILK